MVEFLWLIYEPLSATGSLDQLHWLVIQSAFP